MADKKGTQGGTPQQHAEAGRQSHKNDDSKGSAAKSGGSKGDAAKAGRQSQKKD